MEITYFAIFAGVAVVFILFKVLIIKLLSIVIGTNPET